MKAAMILKAVVLGVLLILAAAVQAQGAPSQMDYALYDLSGRVGHTVSAGSLSRWRWVQKTFPDSALGCDWVAGQGNPVVGFEFELTYIGVLYDYRVSADGSLVVLCAELDPNQPTASSAAAAYSNPLCASDVPYMRTRLDIEMDIEPAAGAIHLYEQPSLTAAMLQQIPAGYPFQVVAGPYCADEVLWWLVNAGGQSGYIVEGQDGEYFVEPKRPDRLPSRHILNRDNAAGLQAAARVSGRFGPHHAWSPDSARLVLPGGLGAEGVWSYGLGNYLLRPEIIETDSPLTTIEFRPQVAAPQVLFGTQQGTLHLWQILPGTPPVERLYLNAHQGSISALAFHPDGTRFVSSGPVAFTNFPVERDWAAIVWDLPTVSQLTVLAGHRALIRDIAWSPDGGTIATGSDDRTLRFWDAVSGESHAVIELPAAVAALDYSPNGQLLAVGLDEGQGALLFDARSRTQIASYEGLSRGVASLAFSPDSTLLLVGGEDIVMVWDVQTFQMLVVQLVDGAVQHLSFSPNSALVTVVTDKPALEFLALPFGA